MCAILIQQGAEYRKLVEGEEAPSLTADELGVLADISDLNNLIGKFNEAVSAGSVREIEVKPDRKTGEPRRRRSLVAVSLLFKILNMSTAEMWCTPVGELGTS